MARKRSLAGVLVLAGLMVALSAQAAVSAPTVVHFWHAMGGQLGETVDALVKKFNESQGQYEVRALRKGTYAETLTAAIAAYRARNHPHIVQVYEVGTLTMLLSGAIYPVHELMADYGIPVDWKAFVGPVLSYYEKDGKLYSMPFNSSTPILYFNKDAFRKAGLDPARPPATWQEIGEYSRKILDAGAAKCGFTASWPSWTMLENTFAWHDQPFATQENGYLSLDTELLINSDFGVKHIGQLATWQREGIFRYGGRMGDPDVIFTSGDCAMLVQSSAVIGSFRRAITQFQWGTAELPHWGPPYRKQNTIVGGATLWVMKGHRPEEYRGVANFLKFVSEPEQQAWWHRSTGYIAISKGALSLLEGEGHFKADPDQWTAFGQLTRAAPTPNSRGIRLGYFPQIRDVIESELENIFAGKKTAKQGLDDAVRQGNRILREFAELNR